MRPLPLLCALLCCDSALAIDQIRLSAARVDAPGKVALQNLRASLALDARAAATLDAQAASLQAPELPAAQGLRLHCDSVLLHEPRWHCDGARLRIANSPLGELQATGRLRLDSARRRAELQIAGLPIAGGRLKLRAAVQESGWQIESATLTTTLLPLAQWLQRWWQPPPGLQYSGALELQAEASGHGQTLTQANVQSRWRDLNLQNGPGSVVAEKVAADLSVRLRGTLQQPEGELQLSSNAGQALAGTALLDFTAHPLRLRGDARLASGELWLRNLQLDSAALVQASGEARLALDAAPPLRSLRAEVTQLQFPAAYTSFLQLPLAATDFGNLTARGVLRGQVTMRDNRLASLDLTTGADGLDFSDVSKGLELQALHGEFHWLPASASGVATTRLRWQSARAFSLVGGAAELELIALGDTVRLAQPARLPLFDGALAVQRFEARQLGSADVALIFDGRIDSIGMPRLSHAFGWPEMSGTLSGRLPGMEFRGGTLSVAGDVSAQVFDGTIVVSNLRLGNAFGRFPRFSGNFSARNLDLGQITQTFPIGSISGRLDAEVRGLELFGWMPVAFDARLYSSPGDRSRHRISQKAVGNLANLGGGGGGVGAAMQSTFLRFFDDFGYDRIALRCQLRNDVCLMDGIVRPEGGFYIVKGGGLPRLDVVGTAGRIDWSQLLSQIGAALANGQVEVR